MFSRIIFVACVSAIDVYWLQAVQFENIKILPGSIRWSHLSAALSPPAPAGAFLAATLNTALYMASEGEMAHLSREGSDRQLESQEFRSSSLVQVPHWAGCQAHHARVLSLCETTPGSQLSRQSNPRRGETQRSLKSFCITHKQDFLVSGSGSQN